MPKLFLEVFRDARATMDEYDTAFLKGVIWGFDQARGTNWFEYFENELGRGMALEVGFDRFEQFVREDPTAGGNDNIEKNRKFLKKVLDDIDGVLEGK